ncbi:MAG: PDZ domain-containing protein [Clostridia bacterium]|nr:PDZ domain-containing protein [Clostridia bacterium]
MKKVKRILFILILLIILIYVTNISSIPNKIILFKGENLNLNTIFGIYINEEYETVQTGAWVNTENISEKRKVSLKLFNIIDIKDIEVNTIPKTTVIPLGNSVGLKLYTSGVLVVGMSEIDGQKPYENSGIEEGDMIVKINEEEITNTSELINSVNKSKR